MALNPNALVQSFNALYLNPNDANVWFVINSERIPAHRHILSAMCPFYDTMFHGSLPEGDEVDMSTANIAVKSFKEFLKFMYALKPNLTMENIADVMFLAKQSLSDDIFAACEEFLIESLTIDNAFFGYDLAQLYDAKHLDTVCKHKISVNAEKLLDSSSFSEVLYERLQILLQHNSLACEETHIFRACIRWAKAACTRNDKDPTNMQHLRDQLKDAIYQIRFTSMTKEEAASCISEFPGLFDASELEEIIYILAHKDDFQPKKFNWKPRSFDSVWDNGRRLICDRSSVFNSQSIHRVDRVEKTRFMCNQRVLLRNISCDFAHYTRTSFNIIITEINQSNEKSIEHCNQRILIQLHELPMPRNIVNIELVKPFMIRPNRTYEICITFDILIEGRRSNEMKIFKNKVRVDHDIVFQFTNNGIVKSLSFNRFDNKNYFQRVIRNPNVWMMIGGAIISLYYYYYLKPHPLVETTPPKSSFDYKLLPVSYF